MPDAITFLVPGIEATGTTRGATAPRRPRIGTIKKSVVVTAERSGAPAHSLTAVPGEDVVLLHVAGGPELWLHPETARDLLRAQQPPQKRSASDTRPDEIDVPVRLRWRLEESAPAGTVSRGVLGSVMVKAVEILTGFAKDEAADFVAGKVVERFDRQVDAGVYRLRAASLPPLKGTPPSDIEAGDRPSLVFVHGTFSSTAGTFGRLWVEHPQLVARLFEHYGDRVYALDHPTLGVSPVRNAIMLAEAAPDDGRLHLVTHSRGGLVAEVLARVCAAPETALDGLPNPHGVLGVEIQRLAEIVSARRLRVDRLVRVACPARGTLLASKRLDAYISAVKWALELANVPVLDELVAFLGEVARRRAEPDQIPGLAAQVPDSPLVQWLHAPHPPIAGDLRVVAGDLEGDSVTSWVKTLLSDAFYWTDHDLVVQTRSMYGGCPREAASTFVLDRGGRVSHFNYFSNPQTASAIVRALTESSPEGFGTIGPMSWGGESATGSRASLVRRTPAQAAETPALFILPGILGSNLKAGTDRIWLGARLVNNFSRLAFTPGDQVREDGLIGPVYNALAEFLSESHDVHLFAFDWRRPIADEAARLAESVGRAIDARAHSRKPVRILAHSMGGIVARTMQIVSPETWTRMLAVDGSRILMLGTPNGGSFAPMQVLTGDDTFGNLLTMVGAPFNAPRMRETIAAFPGLLELQADLLDRLGTRAAWTELADRDLAALRRQSIWHALEAQIGQHAWGIPPDSVLEGAIALRRQLDRQRETALPDVAPKLLLVVGTAPLTPTDFTVSEKVGLLYLNAANHGDGRVTHQSAMLPGVATWVAPVEHGSLPRHKASFAAYRDLLVDGATAALDVLPASAASRSAAPAPAALVATRPARQVLADAPPQREADVLAATDDEPRPATATAALQITVTNGDLTFTPEALLIGHYRSSKLTGAEAAMDRATGGAMSDSLHRGLYPSGPGTHQIFVNTNRDPNNPWQLPRPQAVIVAGLGPEGELRGADLVKTVRQAVVAWAQRLTEQPTVESLFTLATTLLGSGGSGITPGQAAQLVAQGAREAAEQLAVEGGRAGRWPRIERLVMIELYQDRAQEAWSAIRQLADGAPQHYTLDPVVGTRTGALSRPPGAGYRGADYDFISAVTSHDATEGKQIVYTVNTRRARSDVRPRPLQVSLIRNLVSDAASSAPTNAGVGRTLFSLLIPQDLEPFLGSSTDTVLELDIETAAIPWEVLDAPSDDGARDRPWSIRTRLLRKLRLSAPPTSTRDATAEDAVLVVGDPLCPRETYPELPGARLEAQAVADTFCATAHVTSLISGTPGLAEPDAKAVANALLARPYRIIHIAAHGEPPLVLDGRIVNARGVMLSGEDTFLGPTEIGALRVIPELVFVNCCHLGTSGDAALARVDSSRSKFAAGVAEALIKVGVRCVIAAGWAIDDEAANVFARTFYGRLMKGDRFIDAVALARTETRKCGGNTWAAYQCYGDPDWFFRRGPRAAKATSRSPRDEFAAVASVEALRAALERIAVGSEHHRPQATADTFLSDQAARLRYLEQMGQPWASRGDIAEAFGAAWMKTGMLDEAIGWYQRARAAQDGRCSIMAVEQLANALGRRAWESVSAGGCAADAYESARAGVRQAIALVDSLTSLGPTAERENLRGSAFKRLALIERAAGRPDEEARAVRRMRKCYTAGEALSPPGARFYASMNLLAARIVLGGSVLADEIDTVRATMAAAPPDFWSVVGQTELSTYAAIGRRRLAADGGRLEEEFRSHHSQVAAPRMWASVHDNARFVLEGHGRRAGSDAEGAAATRLLALLEGFAAVRRGGASSHV